MIVYMLYINDKKKKNFKFKIFYFIVFFVSYV